VGSSGRLKRICTQRNKPDSATLHRLPRSFAGGTNRNKTPPRSRQSQAVHSKDYLSFTHGDEIDFGVLLKLVTERLEAKAQAVLDMRKDAADKVVLLFGGALHNTIYPLAAYEKQFSYARHLQKLTGGRYVELDLVVPEYVEKIPDFVRQPWFKTYKKKGSPQKVFLISPRPGYFVLVLPRSGG